MRHGVFTDSPSHAFMARCELSDAAQLITFKSAWQRGWFQIARYVLVDAHHHGLLRFLMSLYNQRRCINGFRASVPYHCRHQWRAQMLIYSSLQDHLPEGERVRNRFGRSVKAPDAASVALHGSRPDCGGLYPTLPLTRRFGYSRRIGVIAMQATRFRAPRSPRRAMACSKSLIVNTHRFTYTSALVYDMANAAHSPVMINTVSSRSGCSPTAANLDHPEGEAPARTARRRRRLLCLPANTAPPHHACCCTRWRCVGAIFESNMTEEVGDGRCQRGSARPATPPVVGERWVWQVPTGRGR